MQRDLNSFLILEFSQYFLKLFQDLLLVVFLKGAKRWILVRCVDSERNG